jgi:hypothetical protein
MQYKDNGAMTVEYAVIFPFVIICVMILIYLGLMFYEQAVLMSVAGENVQNWALLWGFDPNTIQAEEGITSHDSYISKGLYWQLFASDITDKKNFVQNSIREDLKRRSILKKAKEVEVDVNYQNYVIYQMVGVKVTACYPLPLKGLLKHFGLSGDIKLQAYSKTSVHDPKEFIHNADYLLQLYEETGAKDWFGEKCKPLVDSLKKIKEYYKQK